MIEKPEIERIVQKVLDFSTADETEVLLEVKSEALTRFANNIIHQPPVKSCIYHMIRLPDGLASHRAMLPRHGAAVCDICPIRPILVISRAAG